MHACAVHLGPKAVADPKLAGLIRARRARHRHHLGKEEEAAKLTNKIQ